MPGLSALRFTIQEVRARARQRGTLAALPDGYPLRFAPSFFQSLETGTFLVVLGGLDF